MICLLLSAGQGKRLRPLTLTTPKALVEINGRPLLDIWLERLFDHDLCSAVIINAFHLSDQIKEFIDQHHYKNRVHFVKENQLYNTAGSVKQHHAYYENEESIILAHGDNLSYFDLKDFISYHQQHDYPITMMSFKTDDPANCGILDIDNDIVINMYEKQQNINSNIANAAIYIIRREVIDYIVQHDNDLLDFSCDVLPIFMKRIAHYPNIFYHRDIGNKKSLDLAQTEWIPYATK